MRLTHLALVTLGLTGVAQATTAGELIVHTVSLHSSQTYENEHTVNYVNKQGAVMYSVTTIENRRFNNVNPGLAWQFDSGVQLGVYYNSYRKPTAYVAYEYMFNDELGVVVGVGNGYQAVSRVNGGWTMIGAFEYKYPLAKNLKLVTQFIPPMLGPVGVMHAAFAYSFK
jgi:hypothetical protein